MKQPKKTAPEVTEEPQGGVTVILTPEQRAYLISQIDEGLRTINTLVKASEGKLDPDNLPPGIKEEYEILTSMQRKLTK